MMTFYDVRLWYLFLQVVNVRNACDCLCYSQVIAGYLAQVHFCTMTEKWTNLKAATAFQKCVCISNRLVVERFHLYCELLENITFCVSFNLTFRKKKSCKTKNEAVPWAVKA